MNIQQLIDNLKNSKSEGFQIQKRNGIITSTWLIYKRKNKYYYFDINQKLEFIERYSYTENEILLEFENGNFNVEELIN